MIPIRISFAAAAMIPVRVGLISIIPIRMNFSTMVPVGVRFGWSGRTF